MNHLISILNLLVTANVLAAQHHSKVTHPLSSLPFPPSATQPYVDLLDDASAVASHTE